MLFPSWRGQPALRGAGRLQRQRREPGALRPHGRAAARRDRPERPAVRGRPAVRVDALQPGDVVVHEGALRVVRVWEGYFGNREYGYVNFEEGKRWGEGHITATLPCCQR